MPVYKDKNGVLTNLPGPDAPVDPNDPSNYGRGSTEPVMPTFWEGQGLLDAAKKTLDDTAPEAATLDKINATLFPRAAAAKASNPELYSGVVGSQDYADLESQLQNQEETTRLQSSPVAKALDYIGPGTISLAAGAATPFVGPELTIPAAAGATTLLDLAKSHYRSPDAPANVEKYLGDVAESAAAPALVAGGQYALSKAPLLNKPGVVPGVVGAVHGYHRAGIPGAIEEGLGGYYGGRVLDKITGGLSALKGAAGIAPEVEAAIAPESTATMNQALYSGTQTPEHSVEDVLKNMGGRFADKEAGFSPEMVEKLNAPKGSLSGLKTAAQPDLMDEYLKSLEGGVGSGKQSFEMFGQKYVPNEIGSHVAAPETPLDPRISNYDVSRELDPQAVEAEYLKNHPIFSSLEQQGMFAGDRAVPSLTARRPTIQYNKVVSPRKDLASGEFLQQLKNTLGIK